MGAVTIPLLAAATQWINTLFMPQAANADAGDSTSQMMKSMNVTMPLVSAFFCLSLPIGMGIYWISGAVIRSIEQVLINRHIDRMDIDKIVEKNLEKEGVKKAQPSAGGKRPEQSISGRATIKAANIVPNIKETEGSEATAAPAASADREAPKGIAARANMVREYNERKG